MDGGGGEPPGGKHERPRGRTTSLLSTVQDPIKSRSPVRAASLMGYTPGARARAALTAAFWSGSGFVTTQALRTGSRLALARWFLPKSVFGTWTILSGFIAGLQMLSDVGIGPSVGQKKRG